MSWLDQSYMGRKGVARGVAGVGAVLAKDFPFESPAQIVRFLGPHPSTRRGALHSRINQHPCSFDD